LAIETFVGGGLVRCGWRLRVFVPKPNSEVRAEMTTNCPASAVLATALDHPHGKK